MSSEGASHSAQWQVSGTLPARAWPFGGLSLATANEPHASVLDIYQGCATWPAEGAKRHSSVSMFSFLWPLRDPWKDNSNRRELK